MDYKAGMFVYALAFLLGVIITQQLAVLPSHLVLLVMSVLIVLCLAVLSCIRDHIILKQLTLITYFILLIIIGFIYSSYVAKQQLSFRLDESLIGKNIVINGTISNIPVANGKVQRFEFIVDKHRILSIDDQITTSEFPEKVRLSWYYGRAVNAGDKWQFEVRLKPPNGFANPGGFDYEKWLFQQGINATGYVRKSSLNIAEFESSNTVNHLRQSLGKHIESVNSLFDGYDLKSLALIKALAIGDKSSISSQQWRVLSSTGTSHLMAISGLHIGLASMFAYVLIRRIVPASIMLRIPAQHVALLGGILLALLYALIAGLSIPTQRAIIMLFALSVMILIRRNHRPVDVLGFAIFLVLLNDPQAVLSAGFWFSFSAVAVIFISISSEFNQPVEQVSIKLTTTTQKAVNILKRWIRLQLLISIFLLPLSLFMFQQVSLVSPIANLLLIPYVSFLVVPLVLLAIILFFLSPYISQICFSLAAMLLDLIWPLLSFFSNLSFAMWVRGDVDVFKLLAVTLAILLMYYSRQLSIYCVKNIDWHKNSKWVFRLLAIVLFIPLFISTKSQLNMGDFILTVLDVGQGSAAVLQTKNHVLVFDTGAKFSDRLNAGSTVVIPYLRSQGIRKIDSLIISHGDADHIGGAQDVIDEYPNLLLIGQDIENLQTDSKRNCFEGQKWHWDNVDFEFLSPVEESLPIKYKIKRNNRSCVLKVSSVAGSVLFTGDIENKMEKTILKKYGTQLASDILVVPHHGSNTSSSVAFIKAVDPSIALFSTGYKNRYKLPNKKVLSRYQVGQRKIFRTDDFGAIIIKVSSNNRIDIDKYRETAGKYWHRNITKTP